MKKIIYLILCCAIMFHIMNISASATSSEDSVQTLQWDESARLHVSGSKIYSSSGDQFLLRGFGSAGCETIYSKWDTWYNDQSFATIKNMGANTMRLMTEVSYYHNDGDAFVEKYCEYVDKCIDNGLYVVVSWMGNSDINEIKGDAISFFEYMTTRYGDCPYIIYEIANEPKECTWQQIRDYSCEIIPIIREKAPSSLIIVPTGYGFRVVKTNQDFLSDPLPYENLIYQEHFYAGSNFKSKFFEETTSLVDSGYPVIFTEWGSTDPRGDKNYYEDYSLMFLKYCDMHDISWCFFQLSDRRASDGTDYVSSVCISDQWSDTLDDSSLSQGGLLIKRYLSSHDTQSTNSVMMSYTEGYAFWEDSIRSNILSVFFVRDNQFYRPYSECWDVSMCMGSGDVMAYLCDRDLYIVAKNGCVMAPRSNDYVFKNFASLKSLSLDNYDTSCTNYTNALFSGCVALESINFSNYNTSKLTTLSSLFINCTNLKVIDLYNCNLDNVTFYENTFRNCYSLERVLLPNVDIERITSSPGALKNAGKNASGLTIFVCGLPTLTVK